MCLFWTQRKIFWRKFVIRLFWGTIDFHSRRQKYYGSHWCPRTALFPSFFKISSFVFSRTNTFIQVWIYLRMSKWWQDFHFWVHCPFNSCLIVSDSSEMLFWSNTFICIIFHLTWGRVRVLSHEHFWCVPGFDWRQSSVRLDDVNAVIRPRVRTCEPKPSLLKKGGLGFGSSELWYGSLLMWTQSHQIAEVNHY